MSFVKKTAASPTLSSTFSTGISSLDAVLCENTGGLPAGCLLLLLEDQPKSSNNHASQVLRCFISEGLHSGQAVYFESPDGQESPLLSSLPERVSGGEEPKREGVDKLSIAWRYKHLQISESMPLGQSKSFAYDLGRHLSDWSAVQIGIDSVGSGSRLVLHGLGSTWMHGSEIEWMLRVRQLCISTRSVAMVSVPSYLVSNTLWDSMIRISSVAIQLQPMKSEEYQGMLKLVKPLRSFGSLRLHLPDTLDLAYRCKRGRRFVVERFHLPPELGSEPSRTTACSKTDF